MAVLVRIKRKRDEIPSEHLILAAPRKRERSARKLLRSTFQGLGLEPPPSNPETGQSPTERRCFRRLDTLDPAAARDLEARTRGETAQRLLREALRLRRKRRPQPPEDGAAPRPRNSPKFRRHLAPTEAICVELRDGALERSSPTNESVHLRRGTSRSLKDLAGFSVERSPTNSSLDRLAPGGARETARDEAQDRRRLTRAVDRCFASEDPHALVELRAACATNSTLATSLHTRDGSTPLMAFARFGSLEDVVQLVALGVDARRVDQSGRDAAMLAHARGHATVRDRLLAAVPPRPPTRTISEVHAKRSFLDGVSAYYDTEPVEATPGEEEVVGLPLDDFVYDVYAYDATADVEPRRVSASRDCDNASTDNLSVCGASLVSRALTPNGGDTLSSASSGEDEDGLSTRCVVSPIRRFRGATVLSINHPLRDVLSLPRAEDDREGTDGDDDVSSLGADETGQPKSVDDRSLSCGSLDDCDDDRSFRSRPHDARGSPCAFEAWDAAPPFHRGGSGPPAASFPSHRDGA